MSTIDMFDVPGLEATCNALREAYAVCPSENMLRGIAWLQRRRDIIVAQRLQTTRMQYEFTQLSGSVCMSGFLRNY